MRAAIRAVPDGVYTFEDYMDDSGPGTAPLRVAVAVTVAGDGMVIDYGGSSPQTASGMNSYINYTRSYSYAAGGARPSGGGRVAHGESDLRRLGPRASAPLRRV